MSTVRIRRQGGCLFFQSDQLQQRAEEAVKGLSRNDPDFVQQFAQNRIERDGDEFHLTLISKADIPRLCRHFQVQDAREAVLCAERSAQRDLLHSSPNMITLGIGSVCQQSNSEHQCSYQVICWPDATVWRHRLGLSPQDFHVTLGFRPTDVHDVCKNHTTLLPRDATDDSISSLEDFERVAQASMKHLQSIELTAALEEVVEALEQTARREEEHQKRRRQLLKSQDGTMDFRERKFLAMRTKCKLRSNQRRFEEVVECANECLDPHFDPNSDYQRLKKPIRALRALSLVNLGFYQEALEALEEALMHMPDLQNPRRIELLRAATKCRGFLGEMEPFTKFPRTAHLFDAGGKAVTRDDLIVQNLDFFLNKEICVEEKVDGSNMGFSVSSTGQLLCQNRSHYVTASSQSQFQKLPLWLEQFGDSLREILEPGRHILFGEWCAMVHSLHYPKLPGLFVAFDLYDKYTDSFATRNELHSLLQPTGIPVVPIVCKRTFASKDELLPLLETKSKFRDGTVEGVYLRYEGEEGHRRCKLVRPDFVSGIALHWSTQLQKKNLVCQEMALSYNGYTELEALASEEEKKAESSSEDGDNRMDLFDPRSKVTVDMKDGRSVQLMRNFSFLFPGQLAVGSTPKRKEHIDALRRLGVSLVITLTEEEPLDKDWFGSGIENLFVPVPNYEPPTLEQMEVIRKRVQQTIANGGIVMEHCGGGKGRAGTVAACLLVRFGADAIPMPYVNQGSVMNSKEAIAHVRAKRPGSLETDQQERFVQQYTQYLWKQFAEAGERDEQPVIESKEHESDSDKPQPQSKKEARAAKELAKHRKLLQKRAPDIVVLVGLPGSGKSTFSGPLVQRGDWKRISQDEMGRKKCEELAGRWSKMAPGKVVLDRCNVETSDRRHWLGLMHHPCAKRTAAIYFDVPVEECVERVRARSDHPTIRGGTNGSERIVRGFHERLEVPTKAEGFGQVLVVRSFEDSQKILRSWGLPP